MRQDPGPVVVILESTTAYQMTIADGIRRVLEPLDVPTVIHLWAPETASPPPSLVRLLRHGQPRGLVVVAFGEALLNDQLCRLLDQVGGVPTVHIARPSPIPDASSVRTDNELGMRLLAQHLVNECNARKILLVRGQPSHPDSQERESIMVDELDRLGAPVPPDLRVDGGFLREPAYQAVLSALERHPGIDAVAAFNDMSAIGAMDAIRDRGLRIPEDIMVCGFDDEPAATLAEPSLTTINQNLPEQGAIAARMLLDLLDGKPSTSVLAPVSLVVRESTRAEVARSSAEKRAELLRLQTVELDTTLALSRAFMLCTTVPQAIDQLRASLPRLNADRSFLVLGNVLLEPATPADSQSDGIHSPSGERGRVLMAHTGVGSLDTDREQSFDLVDLLPPRHRGELQQGTLMIYPMWTGETELGYLLIDRRRHGGSVINDVLRLDLYRCLNAIRSRMRLAAHADELERQVVERTAQLEKEVLTRRSAEQELLRLNAELQDSVHRDSLTGLSSRSAFQEALATHWESHGRSGRPMSLLMVDVDHFKSFNDQYGHLRGDEALRVVARCLRAGLGRQGDLAARYGGEEFALILPNTPTEGAIRVAQRVRRLMAEAAVPHLDSSVGQRLTVSIGVATAFPDPYGDPAQLVAAADLALYDVKNSGRDGVSTASSPIRGIGDVPTRTETATEPRRNPPVPAPRLWT